jgi:hypothetical protein
LPFVVNPPILASAQQPESLGESLRGQTSSLGNQAMTALLTAPPQYIATPWSAHATAKAVRFGAAPAVRLKGTFQSVMLPTVVSDVKANHLKYLAGRS